MDGYRKTSHAVHEIKYHDIWVTKYRYKVLHSPIAQKARELIRQGCEARGIVIMQESVGKDHIHRYKNQSHTWMAIAIYPSLVT
jgi:putative transposase